MITTPEEYEAALARCCELVRLDPELSTPDGVELDQLADELIAYEAVHFPDLFLGAPLSLDAQEGSPC